MKEWKRLVLAAIATAAVLCAPRALAAESHSTHGDIVGFGPARSYVSIAHEDIPGYMKAMTMSFEPRRPAQLEGLEVGTHIAFSFTATDDGHRLIDRIQPQAR